MSEFGTGLLIGVVVGGLIMTILFKIAYRLFDGN
jgi:hypothetical protein